MRLFIGRILEIDGVAFALYVTSKRGRASLNLYQTIKNDFHYYALLYQFLMRGGKMGGGNLADLCACSITID